MSKKVLSSVTQPLGLRRALGLVGLSLAGLAMSCNSHPVSFSQTEGAVVITEDRSPDSAASVDILWMIDNSGSMCQEQEAIRENFQLFIDQITKKNIDFQMGVTTTHMDAISSDQVTRPGYLQAIPQPVPSVLEGCAGQGNEDGKNTDADPLNGYRPIRVNIDQAIACTRNPAQWEHLRSVTDNEIACIYGFPDAQGCGEDLPERHQLFPTTPSGGRVGYATPEADNPYRGLRGGGKVLRSADYRDANGSLDVEALKADFACMSLVGTQGSGFEKGLASAVHAISPKMTGGTVEKPLEVSGDEGPIEGTQAPNHGLLRDGANFALIFVTDENDCSDYALFAGDDEAAFKDAQGNKLTGGVDVRTACQDTVCAIYNTPGFENSPLIKTEKLAERLMVNLKESKGKEINKEAVVVTSIHGDYRRYGESYPSASAIETAISAQPAADQVAMREKIHQILANPNSCDEDIRREPYVQIAEKISCGSPQLGDAFSGDRYERFLRHFSPDRVLPAIPERDGDRMPGLICSADGMGVTLGKIGELIAGSVEQCITSPPFECDTHADCPAFSFSDDAPACQPFGRGSEKFCNSGLQLRLFPGTDEKGHSFEELKAHPYCIPESIDSELTPGGCIIRRDMYSIEPCVARDSAINLVWSRADSFNDLAGYQVKLVYALLPEGAGGGGEGGAGEDASGGDTP